MRPVQFPAAVLPPSEAESPLGRFLAAQLSVPVNHRPGSILEHTLEAALALGTAYPFDPAERVRQSSTASLSLLEAVLELAPPNRRHPRDPNRIWPATLEGFAALTRPAAAPAPALAGDLARMAADVQRSGGALPWAQPTVDVKWVAAALVAAGCNPWTDPPPPEADPSEGRLPTAVEDAMRLGLPGLVARFLDLPGAWSPSAVLAAPFGDGNGWTEASSHDLGAAVLARLVDRGARLDPATVDAVPLWSEAHPVAVPALLKAGLPVPDAAARNKIEASRT